MHPSHHARTTPDRPAYIMAATGRQVSYAELESRSNRLAHFWRSLGLKPGDTIAFLLENHESTFPLVWSAQRSGLIYVSISTGLSPADVAYIVQDSGASILINSARTQALADEAASAFPHMRRFAIEDGAQPGLETLVQPMPDTSIPDEMMGDDMLYSSGTTGRPKGILRLFTRDTPIDQVHPLTTLAAGRFGFGPETRYLSPAPLYHAAPQRWSMTVHRLGGTVVVMDKFDAEWALELIERHRITAAQWVPTHFIRMLRLTDDVRARYDLSTLTVAIHAAAPCPVPIKEAMIDWWGPVIHEYYAGTESNGLTTISSEEWLTHKGSVGKALVGDIHIADEDEEEAPVRTEGLICFSNGPAFAYHNDPEKTAKATTKHGWTTLGDVGWVDEEGYLTLTDRKNFMIISGGVNIYPQEIENWLITHPGVGDVAVIGIPDEDLGERVLAVIEPLDWADANDVFAAELIVFAREGLGRIKAPKQVDFLEALPRQATGKLYKRLLRDQYWPAAG
jgi:acyl-CoA synthetase (AMP-forming)/AMP-acid ligase II